MVKALRLGILSTLLSGCSFAPRMSTPQVTVPDSYKEAGDWVQAQPSDRLPRESWWALYETAELNDLGNRLLAGNPSLAAAAANYAQAKALSDEARAGLLPTVGLSSSASRARESRNAPLISTITPRYYDDNVLSGSVSYEFDLWGRVRNEVAAGRATAQATLDDLENARLLLLAQLVDDYVQLRGFDRQIAYLGDTVKAYDHALTITRQRYGAGIAGGLDVSQAETQLRSASSQLDQIEVQRALMEHAIAALLGVPASSFSLAFAIVDIKLPAVPAGVPGTLVERRPDIASAQRRMVAANANIGVARAAYFPSLSLGGQGGVQSMSFAKWLTLPSTFWAVGPSAALSLLDGGLRRAQVTAARAVFESSAANYREVAMAAFQQVEDSIARLHHYRDAATEEKAAVAAAQRTLDLSTTLYKQGATDYLNVVTSQTALLQAQLQSLSLDTLQLSASVDLIRALGGGWDDTQQLAAR